jgi:hypothetical protein
MILLSIFSEFLSFAYQHLRSAVVAVQCRRLGAQGPLLSRLSPPLDLVCCLSSHDRPHHYHHWQQQRRRQRTDCQASQQQRQAHPA